MPLSSSAIKNIALSVKCCNLEKIEETVEGRRCGGMLKVPSLLKINLGFES